MTAFGTRIFLFRSPARITTSAVITLVMLPIGRSVSSPRLHSSVPVAASASTAPLAFTRRGMPVTGLAGEAGAGAGEAGPAAGAADRPAGAAGRVACAAALVTAEPTLAAQDADGEGRAAADQATAAPAIIPLAAAVAVRRTRMRMPLRS